MTQALLTALAAIFSRAGTLLILLCGALTLDPQTFAWLAVTLGLSAALQVLLDPGAVPYLSVTPRSESVALIARRLYGLQTVAGALTILIFAALGGVALGRPPTSTDVALGSLALIPVAENYARIARVWWLRRDRMNAYRAVDWVYAALKAALAVAILLRAPNWLLPLGVSAGIVIALAFALLSERESHRAAEQADSGIPLWSEWFNAVQYGLPMMAAAAYSQVPVVLMTAFAPIESAAVLATALRLVQPVEIIPGSITQMRLPRIAAEGTARRLIRALAALGVPIALLTAGGGTAMIIVSGQVQDSIPCLIALSCLLPVKFANYAQAAELTGRGRPMLRLYASVGTGAVALVAVGVTLPHGPLAVAIAMAVSELVLFLLLLTARKVAR